MSRTEPRRPLRLLQPAEVAGRPAAAAQAAAQQSADRFRRTLGATRRQDTGDATPDSPTSSTAASARDTAAPHAEGGGLQAASDRHPALARPAAPLAAARTSAILHALPPREDGPAPEALDVPPDGDGLDTPPAAADDWPQRMAASIATLCARADPAIVNWTVTIPMDPAVLPDTTLQLSLSQHWLALRFSTQSPHSHHLVCQYRPRLLEQLERLPQLPHGIDIEVL